MACVLLERLPIRKNYKMLSIRVKTFAKFRASIQGSFLWMLLLSPAAYSQTLQTVFSQPFNYATYPQSIIKIAPITNWGVFATTNAVSITVSNNLAFKVFDMYGRQVFTGTSLTTNFGTGHYFVECNGDRNQFCVLPADYAGATFLADHPC